MGGIMSIGRSRAKTYSAERPGTTFADVAGYEGVKQEINEVVDFLKFPERFAEIGARIPKGILLVGPPGTGKTLIARAVAGEAGVPFLSVTRLGLHGDVRRRRRQPGPRPVRSRPARWAGPSSSSTRSTRSAASAAPASAVATTSGSRRSTRCSSEMDGFEATDGIVMMAATNRPDILDPALLRPGRFDRQVVVPLPEYSTSASPSSSVHCKGKRIAPDVDLERRRPRHARHERRRPRPTSSTRPRCSPCAAAPSRSFMQDFEQARDRVLMGQERESTVLSDKEKELTAYHEAGHAVCAAVLPNTDPIHKVTILPRAWPSASRSSCRPRSATATARTTSRSRSSSPWAAASPRSSCSASCRPAPTTTSWSPPSGPARWCASGA